MSLDPQALLADFDGRHVEPLAALAAELTDADLDALLGALGHDDARVQTGATWIVKRLLETGRSLDATRTARVLDGFDRTTAPEARLHLWQILPFLEIDPSLAPALHAQALRDVDHDHVFVRAWAYNGLAVVARLDPALTDEVEAIFDAAGGQPASVRARIRNARQGKLKPPRSRTA